MSPENWIPLYLKRTEVRYVSVQWLVLLLLILLCLPSHHHMLPLPQGGPHAHLGLWGPQGAVPQEAQADC